MYLYLQELPKWWAWYYWICPTAWTVNGLITSQYADLQKNVTNILPTGETSNIIVSEYLNKTFGFHTDFLGQVAAVLVVFPILFALLFIFFVKTLNFQRRWMWAFFKFYYLLPSRSDWIMQCKSFDLLESIYLFFAQYRYCWAQNFIDIHTN